MTTNEEPSDPPAVDATAPLADEPTAADTTTPAPDTLDPERDDVDRNAAGGGWEGVNEVIENDFETEQLRRDAASTETQENPR